MSVEEKRKLTEGDYREVTRDKLHSRKKKHNCNKKTKKSELERKEGKVKRETSVRFSLPEFRALNLIRP